MTWYINATEHYIAGITLSLTDRLFSGEASRYKKERMEKKLEQVTGLNQLAETETKPNREELRNSQDYFDSVQRARHYFKDSGIDVDEIKRKNLVQRTLEKAGQYKHKERLNSLTAGKSFAVAYGAELVCDAGVGLAHIAMGVGNGIAALGHTSYQGLSLFLGMQTGKGILYVKDILKSKEEKELDRMAEELTQDGKLLEVVRNYSRTGAIDVQVIDIEPIPQLTTTSERPKSIEDLTDIGQRVGKAVVDKAGEIGSRVVKGLDYIRDSIEARRKANDAAEEVRKKKVTDTYDKY